MEGFKMTYHSAWERLYLAVEYLASSEGSLLERLEVVYQSHLLPLRLDEFKSERARELFNNIMSPIRLHKMNSGKLSNISDDDTKSIAKDIVSLLTQITVHNDED
jgi:hypothetical protein